MRYYTVEQLNDAAARFQSAHQDFLKHILIVASTLLAILTAFPVSPEAGIRVRILFLVSLLLLLLGILGGSVALYAATHLRKRIFERVKEQIQNHMGQMSDETISENPLKIFSVCEKAAYVCLMLALLSLTSYAVLFSL